MIFYLTQDLMMASNVKSVAKSEQLELVIVPTVEKLVDRLKDLNSDCEKVIVDLQTPKLTPSNFGEITKSCEEKKIPAIGYAQHVHVDLIQAAQEAGFAAVLTRGQMNGNVAAILTQTT